MKYSAAGFTIIPLNEDPLKGCYGLLWFERKPSSLVDDEWLELARALEDGRISAEEFSDWRLNVR